MLCPQLQAEHQADAAGGLGLRCFVDRQTGRSGRGRGQLDLLPLFLGVRRRHISRIPAGISDRPLIISCK
jgi:hypothetical protein